jgi:glycosyltransferase involved in cell wall biosynthesis
MKILQVIPFFGPAHGGSARASYDISACLSERGHQVTFLTSDYLLGKQWVSSLPTVKVYSFKTWVKLANFFITPALLSYAKSSLQAFDVIHMHNFRSFQNVVVAYYARKYGVPYIVQAHGSLPVMMGNKRMKIIYDSLLGVKVLQGAARVVALNRFEAKQYVSMGVSASKVKIIPNGLNISEFSKKRKRGKFREKFNIPLNHKLVLYLGRVHAIKGLDVLLQAFSSVSDDLREVRLAIVGPDDGYLRELLVLVRLLGLEKKVVITGPLFGEEKFEAYEDADVYVLPSSYETFPIGLLEAYACSKPAVVSKVGNTDELVVEGLTGFLVTYGDVGQLADRIKYLFSNPDRAREMGEQAALFVNNFGIESVVGQFEALFDDIQRSSEKN